MHAAEQSLRGMSTKRARRTRECGRLKRMRGHVLSERSMNRPFARATASTRLLFMPRSATLPRVHRCPSAVWAIGPEAWLLEARAGRWECAPKLTLQFDGSSGCVDSAVKGEMETAAVNGPTAKNDLAVRTFQDSLRGGLTEAEVPVIIDAEVKKAGDELRLAYSLVLNGRTRIRHGSPTRDPINSNGAAVPGVTAGAPVAAARKVIKRSVRPQVPGRTCATPP